MGKMYPVNLSSSSSSSPSHSWRSLDQLGVLIVFPCLPEKPKEELVVMESELRKSLGISKLFSYGGYSFVLLLLVAAYFWPAVLLLSATVALALVTWFTLMMCSLRRLWRKELKRVRACINEYKRAIEILRA
jgi:hypothetical protein